MKKTTRNLLIICFIIVIIKICLAYFILAPSAFSDDYGYSKLARGVWYYHSLTVYGDNVSRPPLYSILLSPSYILKDMELVFFFMKVINALISSLIIIPAWLLSREFFSEKKSFILTTMIVVLPSHFSFTYFLMAENLFYPLFLFSIYFIYKSFTEEHYRWDILAGVFIGLAYLSKINALILPVLVVIVFLFKILKRDYKEFHKKFIMAILFLITISPLMIWNVSTFGFNKAMFLGSYASGVERTASTLVENTQYFLGGYIIWVLLYLSYLMLASGFIFFIANFFTFKNLGSKKFIFSLLTFLSAILLILLASRQFKLVDINYQTIFSTLIGGGRIIGRYVEVVMPLIFINGLLGFKYLKNIQKKHIFIIIVLLLFSSQLIFFQLFPINNMSLTWLGVLKFIFDYLLYGQIIFESIFSYWYLLIFIPFFTGVLLFLLYLQRKISIKKLLYIFILFFSLVNLLNFAVVYYNTDTFWYKSEQTQLGLWFNKYDTKISNILFDERDGCKIFKTNQTCIYNPITGGGMASVVGFWMNDELTVGSVDKLDNVDYVISRHELDLPLIKETKNGIFLYKTDREK